MPPAWSVQTCRSHEVVHHPTYVRKNTSPSSAGFHSLLYWGVFCWGGKYLFYCHYPIFVVYLWIVHYSPKHLITSEICFFMMMLDEILLEIWKLKGKLPSWYYWALCGEHLGEGAAVLCPSCLRSTAPHGEHWGEGLEPVCDRDTLCHVLLVSFLSSVSVGMSRALDSDRPRWKSQL